MITTHKQTIAVRFWLNPTMHTWSYAMKHPGDVRWTDPTRDGLAKTGFESYRAAVEDSMKNIPVNQARE